MSDWSDHKQNALKAWQDENYDEATKHWVAAIKMAEAFGKEDGRFVLCLDNLARVHYVKGEFARAEKLYRQALATRDRNLQSGHEDIATSANNLAAVLFFQKKYDECEKLFRKALTIRKKAQGEKSNEIAWILYQLAVVFHAQKKYEQAEDYYKQAMDLKNKILGSDHIELVDLLRNYSDLLRCTGREPTAEHMENFALSIERKYG